MTEQRRTIAHDLPSGLTIVEYQKPAALPSTGADQRPGLKCAHCGKESRAKQFAPLVRITTDGFHDPWPTCEHGKYVVCPDCYKAHKGCPVCGSTEEYTSGSLVAMDRLLDDVDAAEREGRIAAIPQT